MELRYVGVASATDAEAPRIIALATLPLTLGRKAAAGVVMVTGPSSVANGQLLSRKHTPIAQRADGTLGVTDLGSVNGSFLNGAKLAAKTEHAFPVGSTLALGGFCPGLSLCLGLEQQGQEE